MRSSLEKAGLPPPPSQMGDGGSERRSDPPEVTQHVSKQYKGPGLESNSPWLQGGVGDQCTPLVPRPGHCTQNVFYE